MMIPRLLPICVFVTFSVLAASAKLHAAQGGKLTKRKDVFAFTKRPTALRDGNEVRITFAVKDYCDVTVAIEAKDGKIIRHLASGVLGPNAPAPFKKSALEQTLTWDGKDDAGRDVDRMQLFTARVSLGLKPRFERTLFWSPHKRTRGQKRMQFGSILSATPEGVYAYDGGNGEHIRLFDHEGNYVRTIHPPPADKLSAFKGLIRRTFPQDGKELPLKYGLSQNTFLTTNLLEDTTKWPTRHAGNVDGMTVSGDRIYLTGKRLNLLATDGSTGGATLHGPELWFTVKLGVMHEYKGGIEKLPPESTAVSPDGKYLYMTGYFYTRSWHQGGLNGVARMPADASERPEPFLGHLKQGNPGTTEGQFNVAASVAVDTKGRIYVADFLNDRIQVFDADGGHLKSIKITKPALVQVNPKNGEIYVFSWSVPHKMHAQKTQPRLTRLGPFGDPKTLASFPLDIQCPTLDGHACHAAVDFWTSPTTIWISESPTTASYRRPQLERAGIRLYVEQGGKLVVKRDFNKDALKEVGFIRPPENLRQRLRFDPAQNRLYACTSHAEWRTRGPSMLDVARIDPNTGKAERVALPFDAEDLAFDLDGKAYLRTKNKVARFDPADWQEDPFHYGEEVPEMTTWGLSRHCAISAIVAPGPGVDLTYQAGAMHVTPKGFVVVPLWCGEVPRDKTERSGEKIRISGTTRSFKPKAYPGRAGSWAVQVWDSEGNPIHEDAAPGVGRMSSVAMDPEDNLYVMLAGVGRVKGKKYENPVSCAVFRMKPGTRILSPKATTPLSSKPTRPHEVLGVDGVGDVWIEKADWVRGGAGLNGKRSGCLCRSQSEMSLDAFARVFLPEVDRYSVLVVDANGNEIVRIGTYGNVDDGMPIVKDGGPPTPRSIGGDEVALMHAPFLAVHTDRRLFVGDVGNARICAVKLGYHAEEKVRFK